MYCSEWGFFKPFPHFWAYSDMQAYHKQRTQLLKCAPTVLPKEIRVWDRARTIMDWEFLRREYRSTHVVATLTDLRNPVRSRSFNHYTS